MEYIIDRGPDFSVLKVKLSAGESITAEPGAYMLHRGEIDISTGLGGQGMMSALGRMFLGGESIFLNTFRARGPSEIWFVPPIPGDIKPMALRGTDVLIQDTSYLAHVGDVKLGIAFRGFRGFIAEGEIIWLRASGTGTVFINSFGAIEEIELGRGERMTVDNGHAVAMEASLRWNIRKLGGIKTLLAGGEGLVIEVEGPGRMWLQTRTLASLGQALTKFILKGEKK
ncbi:MAG: TIGR00266 family protein [Acidilobaceae archaeon]|nr:TIGR00266 family protein [Acidilobaceae archaeon]MCX8165007.1 TIGR00266 family protein [Acidilobaceae archaeon]MDW7974476.1 TIGR00266 family protein [Sulfolobales archaeon]